MALEDYRYNMETCRRCSCCKFIPLEKVTAWDRANVCPSISRFDFHSYCAGGRLIMGTALLENELEITDKVLDVLYKCHMCGGCDTSCKYSMDMEVIEPMNELRIHCVENGHTLPALDKVIDRLRESGTMVSGAAARRGEWAEGLGLKDCAKEKADVIFHAGCQTCADKSMWSAARTAVKLLQRAGVEVGFAGDNESCCGGRAYEMGYKAEFLAQAERNMELIRSSGASTLVTGCAHCYQAFKVLYEQYDLKGELEVLHITEYLSRLINEKKLIPTKPVDMVVTWHDPCHLGRMGEPYIHWDGVEIVADIRTKDPPKEYRRGDKGVYAPPREVLGSVPGLKLVEMYRTKEYAWCCGAGGGTLETNPEFSDWTAQERISEAEASGANAVVTSCPWCVKAFKKAVSQNERELKVYDIVELLDMAIEGGD